MLQKPIQSELDLESEVSTEVEGEAENETTEIPEHPEDFVSEEETGAFVHPDNMEDDTPAEEPQAQAEEPLVEAPPPSVDTGADIIAALQEEVAALRASMEASAKTGEGTPTEGVLPENPDAPVAEKIGTIDFVGEDGDITDITMTAEGLNEFATRILNAAVQTSIQHSYSLAQSEAQKVITAYAYSREFYDRYPELREHSDVVEKVSMAIETKTPDITPQQLFAEAAKQSYAKIGKRMPAPRNKRVPGFTNATSATTGKSVRKNSDQQDVLNILKHKGKL